MESLYRTGANPPTAAVIESMEKLGLMPPGVLPEAGDLGTIV
jgi:hypothetical protein